MYKLLLLLILVVSCASLPDMIHKSELEPYMNYFDKNIVDHGDVSIMFDIYEDDSSVLGTCYYMIISPNYITINVDEWPKLTDLERKALVLHEGAHCVCLLDHTIEIEDMNGINDVERFTDGCVKDILYPYMVSHVCMLDHEQEYIKLLKSQCKGK